jgi:hypothetical protein
VAWSAAVMVLAGCAYDSQVVSTADSDYTMRLQIPDTTARVGDEVPVVIRLSRTDNSYLQRGLLGAITVTSSGHGAVDASSLTFRIDDDSTREFLAHVVFTAGVPGVAEVRATFLDATARIRILVSEGGF